MPIESYITLFLTLIVLAYKPGPGFFLNASYGIKEGFLASFTFIAGAALVCGVYFAASVQALIFGTLIIDTFVIFVKGAGAAYMVYMGLKSLGERKQHNQIQQVRTKPLHEYFLTGIFFEMGNPFTILFFMALIPTVIPMGELDTETTIVTGVFVFIAMLINYGSISLISSIIGKKFIKQEKLFKYLDLIMSFALIFIGLLIAASAVPYVYGKIIS